MTIRQVWEMTSSTFAHRLGCGTAEVVVDRMQEWFESGACDGFNLSPAYMPGPAFDFIDKLLPELRRRGLFHANYEGTTLRENLGLAPKTNQFAGQ